MLLRYTVSALALAASLSLNGVNAPLRAAPDGATPAPSSPTDVGGSSAGLTCPGCAAAGVVTLATGGWFGWFTLSLIPLLRRRRNEACSTQWSASLVQTKKRKDTP